jgi:tRNA 2-thiocytidine biosynthesis protein TtcA
METAADKLERKLLRDVGRAIEEWDLIRDGDRVMVCVSGGKDSLTMLHLLRLLMKRAPLRYEIVALTLDQGHPGFPAHVLREHFEREGYAHRIVFKDTYKIVLEKVEPDSTYCGLCSRLRRGILYNLAVEMGATKIALGHHRDDVLETLFLNLLHTGQLKAMPVKLRSDDGRNTVIRPLAYAPEDEIAEYAALKGFPIIPCDLCGSQEDLERKRVKGLLAEYETRRPGTKSTMLRALRNVVPTHLWDPRVRRDDAAAASAPSLARIGTAFPRALPVIEDQGSNELG